MKGFPFAEGFIHRPVKGALCQRFNPADLCDLCASVVKTSYPGKVTRSGRV